MSKNYFIYIMSNKKDGVLYVGITNDIIRRVYEHKNGLVEGFIKEYNLDKLIYYEIHTDIEIALKREKLIKKWKRNWKNDLIAKQNPNWDDLYEFIL